MEASSSQGESMSSSLGDWEKQQQCQAHNMAGQPQHEALASLFRSLSSLAASRGISQQFHQNSPPPLSDYNALELATSKTTIKHSHAAPPNSTESIADSIQSVVAAAMTQQQRHLVVEAMSRQQRQRQLLETTQSTLPHRAPPNASHQPVPLPGLLCDQMNPAPNYDLIEQQRTPAVAPSCVTDREVQLISTASARPTNLSVNTQSSQRINYCTICNKELCNKYFMKTHMLKMHGINLEMEQQQQQQQQQRHQTSATGERVADSEKKDKKSASKMGDDQAQSGFSEQIESSSEGSTSNPECNQTDGQFGESQQSVSDGGPSSQATPKNKPTSTGTSKQTTSVLNGFAGNSMGGVVCDICNKELCSKYFLKVHKQNTHGIVTDYQDASQFVYPFVNPLTGANPFLQSTMSLNPANILPYAAMCGFNSGNSHGAAGPSANKRLRSDRVKQEVTSTKQTVNVGNEPPVHKSLDPLYGLMLAQQTQQQPPQQQQALDQINRVGPMMCYGAMGPFGPPAGFSPTMIVELILRNQHLFNRDNLQQGSQLSSQASSRPAKKDKSIKSHDTKSKSKAASSKDSSNSRYFIHYTEACPMCDRRFKSIKWLKTHMMNDHKQEIAAYMQMILQSMCPTRDQPQHERLDSFTGTGGYPQAGLPKVNVGAGGNFEPCPNLVQKLEQKPLRSSIVQTPILTGPMDVKPSPSDPTIQAGLLQTIHNDQFSLIRNYLDQQRKILQDNLQVHQAAINLSSADSSEQLGLADQNQIGNLDVMSHISLPIAPSTSASSSPLSSAKPSPHSMSTLLDNNDQQQSDQLDLSIKYNSDNQSLLLGADVNLLRSGCEDRSKLDECAYFAGNNGDDDDCSTRSSPAAIHL